MVRVCKTFILFLKINTFYLKKRTRFGDINIVEKWLKILKGYQNIFKKLLTKYYLNKKQQKGIIKIRNIITPKIFS